MNKKQIIIISMILIMIGLISIFLFCFHRNASNIENRNINNEKNVTKYEKDEENDEYIVYDSNGKEITRFSEEVELEILKDNPNYNPRLY